MDEEVSLPQAKESVKKLFKGRHILIATMHGKEKVLAPKLTGKLGVIVSTPEDFNSDSFGTFSGEIERNGSPVEAAMQKCVAAFQLTGIPLVLASEGSFGPHPAIGFIPSDEEIILLKDFENNFEIKAKTLSTDTNFCAQYCSNKKEAQAFLDKASFPSHAVIIRKEKEDASHIVKGIDNAEKFWQLFDEFINRYGKFYAETDMRAMYNPTRMKVIEETADKLIKKILSTCPQCDTPGFDVIDYRDGLRCSLCGTPTRSTLAYIYGCTQCNYKEEKLYPKGKEKEDPMYCDVCNP